MSPVPRRARRPRGRADTFIYFPSKTENPWRVVVLFSSSANLREHPARAQLERREHRGPFPPPAGITEGCKRKGRSENTSTGDPQEVSFCGVFIPRHAFTRTPGKSFCGNKDHEELAARFGMVRFCGRGGMATERNWIS